MFKNANLNSFFLISKPVIQNIQHKEVSVSAMLIEVGFYLNKMYVLGLLNNRRGSKN